MSQPTSLTEALAAHQLELPGPQVEQLFRYCELLWQWNEKLNLTRHTDFEKFVARDVIDSLALTRLMQPGEEVLDVGSGGGVPGILLAILRPDLSVSLSESIGKKAQALVAILEGLGLPVAVHACRAEEVVDQFRFDSLVARAVGPLDKMLVWFQPHWLSIGRLLAVKGPRWTEELAEVQRHRYFKRLDVRCVAEYPMPGTSSQSVILEIRSKPSEG
ncbi:MAG: 16S rRNA (guanine(527)-N(7))-methyltransferase RsmG [Pirellulaceae bacterium]